MQKFILTGSSARKLKRGHANLLAGRAWTLHLHPLTWGELGIAFRLDAALSRGTLPAVALASEPREAREFLRAYVDTYLKEEIQAEAASRNMGGFIRFLSMAGQMNGQPLNFSNIARDVGLSSPTVKEYFSVLEDTLVGHFLLPFDRSERKRHRTAPKFHFFDTGVLRALQQRLSLAVTPATFEFGNCFETFVINEVRRISSYGNKDWNLSFLRTARDVEVDLVLETPSGDVLGIEIKSKPLPEERDFRSGFAALWSLVPGARCLCVCPAGRPRRGSATWKSCLTDAFSR